MKKFVKPFFIIGQIYTDRCSNLAVLKLDHFDEQGDPRFEPLTPKHGYITVNGLVPYYNDPEDFRRAYLWSDLLTPKDRQEANLKVDPLNGKFEDEVLRHLAARRAKLRKLTAILGGEYYTR